jgi:hypothetical protein
MRWNKFKKGMLAALRVQLYVMCVGSVLLAVSLVRAYDKTHHVLGELGVGLLSGLGTLEAGVEQVELNGERFTFGAATSTDAPDVLVSQFEAQCETASGTLQNDVAPLLAEAKRRGTKLPDQAASHWTTMVEHADDVEASHSGCFVRPNDTEEGSLWKRIEQFATTGKLGTLGGFRYLRADRAEGSDYTRVLAISSDGGLDIDSMLPDEGDARGTDPRVASRPPKSTRTFSARVLGSGQGAYLYESSEKPERVLAQYDREIKAKGLAPVSLPDGLGGELPGARTYAADNGAIVLSAVPDDDGKTIVTIFEFGQLDVRGRK